VRRRYAQYYEELQRTVEGAMQLRGQRFLAGEDSRFGLPPREQFWQLQLDDVRGFLMPLLEAEPLEISVVGDFDPEEALRLAARTLGALPPRRSAPGVPRPGRPHFPAARSLELRVPTRIPKGLAVVAYQTDDAWSIGRSRRLSVLADVLSDRLRETIREKLGAAYAPDAGSFTSRAYPGYGYLRAEVETDPAQAGQVLEEIRAIVAGLVRDGVRPEELRRALNPTLTGLKTTRRRNGYWLNQVLTGASRHPQQLEWSRTMLEDYQAVTSEELTDLARTYLQAARAAAIVVRPEEGVAADPPSSGAPRPAAAADDP
jgi:zinc protease